MATWPGLGVKVDGDALIIRPRNQLQDVPVTGQTDELKMLQTAPNNNAVYELFWVETNQADRWYFKKQNTYVKNKLRVIISAIKIWTRG